MYEIDHIIIVISAYISAEAALYGAIRRWEQVVFATSIIESGYLLGHFVCMLLMKACSCFALHSPSEPCQ